MGYSVGSPESNKSPYLVIPTNRKYTIPRNELLTKNAAGDWIPLPKHYKSYALFPAGPNDPIIAVWMEGFIRGVYMPKEPHQRVQIYKNGRGAEPMLPWEVERYKVDYPMELPLSVEVPGSETGQSSGGNGPSSTERNRS